MDWYPWHQVANAVLALPALIVFLFLLGLLLHIRWPRFGTLVLALGTAVLLMASLPLTAHVFLHKLETDPPLQVEDAKRLAAQTPSAIVVLGGGRYANAPEYGGDTVSRYALERLRYAAHLHRQLRLPLLVSAGSTKEGTVAEAVLMQEVLTRDFNVPVKWVEAGSRTTFENAKLSRKLLQAAGIKHVFLVTHAWHMPRAKLVFEQAGLAVTPAPLGYSTLDGSRSSPLDYLPSSHALSNNALALHEYIGYQWYRYLLRSGETAADDRESTKQPQR